MEKETQSSSLFRTKIKSKLFNFENEVAFFNATTFKKLTLRSIDWCLQHIMVVVYSCLCFVSISRGLMTMSIGFQVVPPLKLLSQMSDFSFSWLVCYLVHSFRYIFVYIYCIYYSLIVIVVFFSHELCNFFQGKYIALIAILLLKILEDFYCTLHSLLF